MLQEQREKHEADSALRQQKQAKGAHIIITLKKYIFIFSNHVIWACTIITNTITMGFKIIRMLTL